MSHPIVRWQLVSPDPDASTRFMRDVFGWRTDQANAMGYREVDTGAGSVGGGVWPAPPGATPFVQLFVAVPDVDACLARAADGGATVVVPRTALPDGDVMAVLRDPTGLTVGVCTLRDAR